MEIKGFFQFEIILDVLVSSFWSTLVVRIWRLQTSDYDD